MQLSFSYIMSQKFAVKDSMLFTLLGEYQSSFAKTHWVIIEAYRIHGRLGRHSIDFNTIWHTKLPAINNLCQTKYV